MAIAKQTYYLNSDKSKTVDEGSEDAAYLLVREGGEISDEDAEKYKVKTEKPADEPAVEPNIVITGGPGVQGGIVKGEPLPDAEEQAKTTKKASEKK